MNIGGRITKRLGDLKWERKDLLERVPDLTSQALHNLIRRDSVRSEWDERIAEALGVSVMWLVYGKETVAYAQNALSPPLQVAQNAGTIVDFTLRQTDYHPAIAEVIELMNTMDDVGKGRVLERAVVISSKHAIRKTNKPASSK